MSTLPFSPGASASIAATTSTGNAALAGQGKSVKIHNAGTTLAFWKSGADNTVTAAATDTPIPAGTDRVYTIPSSHTHVAAIMASGTATIYFTRGDGGS